MHPKPLSKSDSRILAQVFDPESTPECGDVLIKSGLPADRHISDPDVLATLRGREREAVACIEQFESQNALSKDDGHKESAYQTALSILDTLLEAHPSYASAHNNRAQLRRWRYSDQNLLVREANASPDLRRLEAASATLADLQTAISLGSPPHPRDPVSPCQARVLGQAYTQLAVLYHTAAKDMDTPGLVDITIPDCHGWEEERFEEEASRLFYLGGLYGNEMAKMLAVHTNPHAKLCGSIVREAMRKEFAVASDGPLTSG
jgi:hypothetical protein